jgi:hypothetical protein
MTTKQYWLICVLAGVCVLLAAERFRLSRALTERQARVTYLQQTINQIANRFPPNSIEAVVRDMSNYAITNRQMLQLLNEAGIQVQFPPATAQTNTPPSGAAQTNLSNISTNTPSH